MTRSNIKTIQTASGAILAAAALATAMLPGVVRAQTPEGVKNVVLVHGAFADGSGWRGVYDRLTAQGYRVTIVQNPLTSLADDVAATDRVLNLQDGPAILVGHSWGGAVITEAGDHPKVAGLVYVAAFAPDAGQSVMDQYAAVPPPPNFQPAPTADGFAFLNGATFRAGFSADLSEADAAFLRDSQVPIAGAALGTPLTQAAWRTKPSWAVVATWDGAIAPELERRMAERAGARITEVDASHVVFISQPDAVAAVIATAARSSSATAD